MSFGSLSVTTRMTSANFKLIRRYDFIIHHNERKAGLTMLSRRLQSTRLLVVLYLIVECQGFLANRGGINVPGSLKQTQRLGPQMFMANPKQLNAEQLRFTLGYLNKHESSVLLLFAEYFSELGKIKKRKNAFTGGSYKLAGAEITGIDDKEMTLKVEVQQMGKTSEEVIAVPLDASPVTTVKGRQVDAETIPVDEKVSPVDDMVRRLNRLCWLVDRPDVTGRLIQLAIQIGDSELGNLKENLYLNQVPHNRYVRQYFYDMAADAVLDAVVLCSQGKISNRMKLVSMFPEMNPSMDSYRIGTILEMARSIAIRLCEQNLRVRICVQGSMGVGIFTGVPKQLNGVAKLLQMMDWQSEEGEENEGMVGNYLNFGAVGKEHVVNAHTSPDGTKVEQDDVFLIIAPQSMVGVDSSIIGALAEMTEAVGDRPIILMNPDLTDKVSAQGQQNFRGRQERIDFANSFEPIFHFQNIYVSGTSYFPILGAMTKVSPQSPWVALQRRDLVNDGGEVYVPVLSSEDPIEGEAVLAAFER